MTRITAFLSLPFLFTLSSVATAEQGPSLRRSGEAVGAQTRGFAFDNSQSLGLMRVVFGYDDGEHDLTRIGHMVGVGASHNWLSSGSPAPYSYDIKHYPAPGSGEVLTAYKAGCQGVCGLGIPAAPAGHVLVLAGFMFESDDGSEHPMTTIAIEPAPDDGLLWVELDDGTQLVYDAAVQYAYIPDFEVNGGSILSASGVSDVTNPRVSLAWSELAGTSSPTLLHGFRIEYADGVARAMNTLHIEANTDRANVWFHDEAGNEPFEATVYVVPTTY